MLQNFYAFYVKEFSFISPCDNINDYAELHM